MADVEYEYTNEGSTDRDLECSICSRPFNDPHRTQCGHICCRKCITHWIEINNRCPMCRRPIKLSDLKKAEDIFHAVNQLFVTCKKCGQSNIRRGQFNDHIENFCCETISNNDMNSDRTIMNKRIESLISQPLRQTQRIREELERQKTTIDNNNNQINNSINTINGNLEEQKDEIQILRQSIVTHRRKIQKLEHTVQIQQEKIEAQENYIDQLETNNRCFQNQIRRLNDNFDEYESRMGNLEETMNHLIPYKNSELEDYITKKCEFGSQVSLREKDLIDRDIEIIVKRVIINRQCSTLDLRRNKITSQGALIISNVFHQNIRLKILDLSYNDISDRGIQYLSEALLENLTLKELSLGSTGITNQGIKYLVEMLQINKTLKKLELYKNNFDDNGMKLLRNVLSEHNKTLNELSLRSNRLITDKSVNVIIDMFRQNQSLDRIELDRCGFSDEAEIRLLDAAKNARITIEI